MIIALIAFSWATQSGQFDDMDSPALSILDDEQPQGRPEEEQRVELDAAGEAQSYDEALH